MNMVLLFSNLMIPLTLLLIILFGIKEKIAVFDVFIAGAKEGFGVVLEILPTIIGLMVGIGVLRSSGFLDFLSGCLKPVADLLMFPAELIPMSLMRLFSSSATTGLVLDIFKQYGPDSALGRMASVIMGSTETVFYTMSVYFSVVNVRKTGYTLPGALLVSVTGIIASVIITRMVF